MFNPSVIAHPFWGEVLTREMPAWVSQTTGAILAGFYPV